MGQRERKIKEEKRDKGREEGRKKRNKGRANETKIKDR